MAQQHAHSLIGRKTALESQLQEQYSILTSNNSTMSTPLVDPEGFPRADIDVWAVRHARVRIIEIRNDLIKVGEELKQALERLAEDDAATSAEAGEKPVVNGIIQEDLIAFARVDGVAPGSPAASAVRFSRDFVAFLV